MRRGLPAFTLVGLPDRAVRESRERVRAALLNSGLEFPLQAAHRQPRARARAQGRARASTWRSPSGCWRRAGRCRARRSSGLRVCGELSLSGELRPCAARSPPRSARTRGRLRAADRARPRTPARRPWSSERGGDRAPRRCAGIASLLHGAGRRRAAPARPRRLRARPRAARPADVRGQADAKRALEIAAAGGHNLLMVGPPGVGKTMLARRLPGHPAAAGARRGARDHPDPQRRRARRRDARSRERPFRAPHHTISAQGLVGGGGRAAARAS